MPVDADSEAQRTISEDFALFQSEFPLLRWHQPSTDLVWGYYQANPAAEGSPVVFLHGTSGTAGAFFYQLRSLSAKGYKVVSAQYPAYASVAEWCKGFERFLDELKVGRAHLFGAGLGGFLSQHYASFQPRRVQSLLLCNSFAASEAFAERASVIQGVVRWTPSVLLTPMLRLMMLDAFPQGSMDLPTKQAIDWVARQVNELDGRELASRIMLNCTPSSVEALDWSLADGGVTLVESSGDTMVPEALRRQLRGQYPQARIAQLKARGDFPFLSQPDEVTLFLEVHLRNRGSAAPRCPELVKARAATAAAQAAQAAAALREKEQVQAEQPPRRPVCRNPFTDD